MLGALEAENGRGPVALGGPRARSVLAVLLIHHPDAVSRARLVDELWGERPPPTAAKTVQVFISRLRKALGDDVLVREPDGYRLVLDERSLDRARFEALLRDGRRHLRDGDPGAASRSLREGLALWRGTPLGDLAHEQFAQGEIARLEELHLAATEDRVDADMALGKDDELVAELQVLVRAHPLRERLREQLMLALYRAGRQSEALAVYRDARTTLDDELGLAPGPGLRELEAAILAHDPGLGAPRRRAEPFRRPNGRRPWRLAAAAVLALFAAGAAAVLVASAGSKPVAIRPGSLAVIDPHSGAILTDVPIGGSATTVAVTDGSVWVGDAGEQTIVRVDPSRRRVVSRTGIARIPSAIAASGGSVWVASAVGRGTITRIAAPTGEALATTTVRVGDGGDNFAPSTPSALAVSAGTLWANHLRSQVLSLRAGRRTRLVDLGPDHSADGLASAAGSLWIASSADDRLLRLDPRSGRVTATIPIAARPGARVASPYVVVAGAGSVWVGDALAGAVSRVNPRLDAVTSTITVGGRPTRLAFGEGDVWSLDPGTGIVSRIDPRTEHVERVARIPEATGLAVGAGKLWVSVGGEAPTVGATPRARALTPVAAAQCSPIQAADGTPQLLVVSDLPSILNGDPALAPLTRALVGTVRFVLAEHGYRAGRFRLGYQACDDATAAAGQSDPVRCAANARAYAANRSVVGVVGPFHSFCAAVQLATLNAAPGGPIATVSPTNTYTGLTRAGPATGADEPERYSPTGTRGYARVVGDDLEQGAALAIFARQSGARRLFVLDDGNGTGYAMGRVIGATARRLGIDVVGRASWDPRGRGLQALGARVRAARPGVVILTGCLCTSGASVLAALKSALPPATRFLASDNMTSARHILRPRVAAALDGIEISLAGRPTESPDAAGRRFLARFAPGRPPRSVDPAVLSTAAATEALIAAISRSDGTRGSVSRALLGTRLAATAVGPLAFSSSGDPTPAPVGIYRFVRSSPVYGGRLTQHLVLDRVIEPSPSLARWP
ncbi:MAG TPA: BTAD domain-containing putative transcriptional regulator [Solirubrobacteraceae bacterium]|nr:BTAD domain-containing putative transcriptional regulator [Solirubrobacteraceae bacterium]